MTVESFADRTIWQAFEAERPQLVQITGPAIAAATPAILWLVRLSSSTTRGKVGASICRFKPGSAHR